MADESVQAIQARAVRGASWTIAAGLASRGLGLVGSLAITYYLNPDVVGDVGAAVVLVLTANQMSTVGVGSYLVSKPREGVEVLWHITVFHVAIGALALAAVTLLAAPLSSLVHAPAAAHYLPWMAVSVLVDRVGFVPERVVMRSLRFRRVAGVRAVAEIAYTLGSLGLAMAGLGGMAVVLANVLRSVIRTGFYAFAAPLDWLRPVPLSTAVYARIFRFGVPNWLGAVADFASSRWDNLLISYLFGTTVMGQYQQAYNLADVPADQIGEQVAEVLLPSFARMKPDDRRRSLVFSTGILAFVVFPVAIGFGAVAMTLVRVVMRPAWWGVGPMLTLLCVLSVLRPLGWQVGAYLLACDRPRTQMLLSFAKLAVMVVALLTLGRFGPLAACLAVGLAFGTWLVGGQWSISRLDGISVGSLWGRCLPPLFACAPMVGAVLATRYGLAHAGVHPRVLDLIAEIVAGVVGYVVGAFTLARGVAFEFLDLVRQAARQRGRAAG